MVVTRSTPSRWCGLPTTASGHGRGGGLRFANPPYGPTRHAHKPPKPHPAAAHWLAVELVIRKPVEKPRNRHRAFQPGQRHPRALMRAGGEGEVAVGEAGDVEALG